MFVKSNLLIAPATRSRGYTDQTRLRGLKIKTLIFSLVHGGGLCLCSSELYSPKTFKTLPLCDSAPLRDTNPYLNCHPFQLFISQIIQLTQLIQLICISLPNTPPMRLNHSAQNIAKSFRIRLA